MSNYISIMIKTYAANYSGLPKACWQAITLSFIDCIAVGMCFFLSLYFVDTLHFDISVAGMLISCYGIGTMTGGIVGGKLSDNISPKIVSVISLFLQACAFFLLIKLQTKELLMLNLFLLGFSGYGFSTSNTVWMLKSCEGQSEIELKAINLSRVAQNLGVGVSGVIIGTFAVAGFQPIFYFFSTLLFLSAIYLVLQKRNSPSLTNKEAYSASDNIKESEKGNKKILFLILSCIFFVGLLISQLSATYPIYVQQAFPELGLKAVSILFLLDTILIVLFQAPLVNYFKNHNKILIAGLGALFMGVGMLVLSFSYTFTLGLISCVIWTTGEMLFVPMSQAICYEKGASKKKGQVMGLSSAVYAASVIVGPTIGGLIYHQFGGDILWYISFIIGLLCFAACYYYAQTQSERIVGHPITQEA